MITPQYLKSGDSIGIIATARKINKEELEPAIRIFTEWGLNVVLGNNIYEARHQYAGTDEQRASDLQKMLDDDTIKAIFIARGGYGTVRIIDKINFSSFKKKPKWIVGFSDVTVLHSHIHSCRGTESLHAAMPFNFADKNISIETTDTIRMALFGKKLSYNIPYHSFNKIENTEGVIIGGNLSLLYALSGTPSDINTSSKILFIEDLDEYLYHIDRMMLQLKRSGKLSSLKGLIVGGMSDMKDNTIPFGKNAYEIIAEAVKEYNYPVCFGFPAGHINDNRALIMGRKIKLDVSKENTLVDFFEF